MCVCVCVCVCVQIFGRVIDDGLLVVRKIESVATGKNNKPVLPVVIVECGEF